MILFALLSRLLYEPFWILWWQKQKFCKPHLQVLLTTI